MASEFLSVAAFLSLFWGLLFSLNFFIKRSNLRTKYERFLAIFGITVALGHVKIFTTSLNRFFARCSKCCPRWQRKWFCVGAIFGLVAMVSSVVILILSLWNTFTIERDKKQQEPHQKLTMVVPGLNLPSSQIVYMVLALLLSAVLHEAGHAVCAIGEGVKLNGFGLFLMLVYPGAFVDLDTESLLNKQPVQQLRIYCAGVWHNFVILAITYMLMTYLPAILSPLYISGQGVMVRNVDPNSPLYSPVSFPVGTVVTDINRCPVTDSVSFWSCIHSVYSEDPNGFCVDLSVIEDTKRPEQVVKYADTTVPVECCSPDNTGDLCFHFDTPTWSMSAEELIFSPPEKRHKNNFRCLNARKVVENPECTDNRDCYLFYGEYSRCLLPSQANQSRLLRVSHSEGDELLYIGDMFVFSYALALGNFVPVLPMLPQTLPDMILNLLNYLSSFSAALALLNAVPCYTLDGQWIFSAMMEFIAIVFKIDPSDKESIKVVVLSFGTLLLVANVCVAFNNSILHLGG